MMFMIEWLQKYLGQGGKDKNMERLELDNLKKEIAKYKKKYEKKDEEMEVHSASDSVRHYMIIFRILQKKTKKNKIK
jgi:hypothetical protein